MSETNRVATHQDAEAIAQKLTKLEAECHELRTTVLRLEREKAQVLAHQSSVDAISTRFAVRFSAIEEELSTLANVYVASYQLSATFKLHDVIKHVRELLGQLVGARSHAVYLADNESQRLVCVASEGLLEGDVDDIPIEPLACNKRSPSLAVARTFATGIAFFADPGTAASKNPTACIPLRVDERVVGVIVVRDLLAQKSELLPVDFELFKLLSAHAGTAIYGAVLFEAQGGRLPSPQTLSSHFHAQPLATVDRNPR
jgi:GAF domain-containing protein